ncbi:MAG: NUDIX hydrolase [Sulfobacillus thermotolerans]|nr:NUDIX hydrolase [Sulfobacillus thermotolerans]
MPLNRWSQWVPCDALTVVVDPLPMKLPGTVQGQIDQFWAEQKRRQPGLFRGSVLTVTHMDQGSAHHYLYTALTDYAHFLFAQRLNVDDPYYVRVLFAAACVRTSDRSLIVGVMGSDTARPGWIQAIGGSADAQDIMDGLFLPIVSARREAREEIGLDVPYEACAVKGYTVDEAGRIAIAVDMAIMATSQEILRHFRQYVQQPSADPELDDVLAVPLGPEGVDLLNNQPRPVVRYLKTLVSVL